MIVSRERLTRGTVGKTMEAEFSAEWEGLAITATFEAGDEKRDKIYTGEPIVIPHEVLSTAGVSVLLGFQGAMPDGTIVKRTEKEWLNNVSETLDPAGVQSSEPTPDWTAQVQNIATEAKQVADSVRSDAQAGKFNGSAGDDGGWYTPAITQPDENTMRFAFTPSKEGMPAVPPKDITIPGGGGGSGEAGGYYAPAVDADGNLSWTASKADMPAVDGTNIKGPQGTKGDKGNTGATGQAGADGKSAYAYAVEGGYTGTEAEFAAKLAEEIPEVDATLTQSGQAADAKAVGDAINSLSEEMLTEETDPTVPAWAKAPQKPSYTASEVGADPSGTATAQVAAHNTGADTHSDIRLLIQGLTDRLNVLADSDDTTLDQFSEVVAYIKSNRSLIEAITTSKVSVADIVDNLTTNAPNKPLSAAQGVAIKTLIDALRNDKLDAAELTNAVNTALAQAKASGEFDGADGAPGKDGQPGKDGVGIQSVVQTTTSTADGGTNIVTVTKTDGTSSTFTVKNGSKGSTGATGADGYTPVKGVDYFDGQPGQDGSPGKDGTSVTVTKVTESAADAGSNVVTFSDGKTVTIKNGSKGSTGADGKSAYQYAQDGGYTGTEAEFTEKLSRIGGEAKKNLFSFENADNNIAWLSKNKPDTNYIYDQSSTHGYKDTDNNYFVFLCPEDRNYGITGGLDNPLPVGSYKLSAELFIPSGNTGRTSVIFGAWIAPSAYDDSSTFDIGAQDTWVQVDKVITVAEGDTANYIYCRSFIDKYPIYVRNIKVISLTPDLEGWEGKKWAAVGDSITEKNSKALKQYHDYIAESTGITVVNMGVSGTGYKRYEDTNNAFYQRILNVPTDVDVVTIFGSGNDLSYALGDVTDTGTDTLCGCINTTIDNLYSVLPNVQFGIITPTPWGGYNPANDNNVMAQYSAKIVEICRLRGIPCLDLYHCSGMRPWDDAFCSSAYNMNSEGDDYDRVHPNSTGHAIFAPRIKAFLQSLIL